MVAAFVGSDLVAGVLATRLHRSSGLRVFIDVGTNTEICAGDRRRLVACSTPSGPAFEGAHIRFGMRAADGAVERVAVEPGTFHVDYRVIGRMKPRGLCGSSLLDLLADLFRTGAIDPAGRLQKRAAPDRIRRVGGQLAFLVVPADETSIGQDLVLTQDDIGQLQLAKAAIHAGIAILLDTLGRTPADIQVLYLAGAFGSYLAPESARSVGMLPDLPLDRVQFVGNTAGSGARLALVGHSEGGIIAPMVAATDSSRRGIAARAAGACSKIPSSCASRRTGASGSAPVAPIAPGPKARWSVPSATSATISSTGAPSSGTRTCPVTPKVTHDRNRQSYAHGGSADLDAPPFVGVGVEGLGAGLSKASSSRSR